jgi:hypothetical protein
MGAQPQVTGPDGVPWVRGAWFGGQVGGTAWMLTGFVIYVWQVPWIGLLFLAGFAGANALGFWLWRRRDRFRFFLAVQIMLLVCGGLLVPAVVAFDVFGSGGLRHNLVLENGGLRWVGASRSELRSAYFFILTQLPLGLLLFWVLDRQAVRRAIARRVAESQKPEIGDLE